MQSHFKTKCFFTFGIYTFFWRSAISRGLRDNFGADVEPMRVVWMVLIPVYGAIIWWRFLKLIQATIESAGVVTPVGSQKFSPARAFWWSSMWFAAGPYINRHLNALYTFQAGRNAATAPAPVIP